MRRFPLVIGGLVAEMLALSPMVAEAASSTISGWELFPGIRLGATVYGATFSVWTTATNVWVSPVASTGGNWGLSINYTGTPGPGSAVAVNGGSWSLTLADGTTYSGAVLGGSVTWPTTGGTNGCGQDIAAVGLVLATAIGGGGTVTGCLDDQHLTTIFPPRVWGTVNVSGLPNPPLPPPDD